MTHQMTSAEHLWQAFASQRPDLASPDAPYSAWHFCDNKTDADELAKLVLAGSKHATAGALWAYEAENEPLPQVGDLHVITDWSGNARCVIRTTSVDVVPFDAVSAEFAAAEGEGDGSLEYWRDVHWAAFGRELASTGTTPTREMPVVCQRFEVVLNDGSGDAPTENDRE